MTRTINTNPLVLLAKKSLVGQKDADEIALAVLLHFDAARRGHCTNPGADFLTSHLIMASYVASRTKSKMFYDAVNNAYAALQKASARPTKELALSTSEYQTIRKGLGWYLRAPPSVEVGVMSEAAVVTARAMMQL